MYQQIRKKEVSPSTTKKQQTNVCPAENAYVCTRTHNNDFVLSPDSIKYNCTVQLLLYLRQCVPNDHV